LRGTHNPFASTSVPNTDSATTPAPAQRPLSLGVIFLTLYIDLVGFSIIFPLGPDLLKHYLAVDGQGGALGWVLAHIHSLSHALGQAESFDIVLFGGVLSSVFSIFQFVFSPFWGALSDRRGRRQVLLFSVAGTAFGYLVWAVSGSFWIFLLSRVITGAFGGNISVATAAVADVTTREERSRAMGVVGAAFGLGLITGPMIGAFSPHLEIARHPTLARFGFNPFSIAALLSFALSAVNVVWIRRRFMETLSPELMGKGREAKLRNPITIIRELLMSVLSLENPALRRANFVAFVFSVAFVAMESSLTFLAAQKFGYGERDNGLLLGFLGFCAVITQGVIVRRLLKTMPELRVLALGLGISAVGLLAIGFAAPHLWLLLVGLALLALGSGFVNPATSGLISLYAGPEEQGRVLGIFRSLGSLSRAITPLLAGVVFWRLGAASVFAGGAAMSVLALALSLTLPKPMK
jgi:MFS family permease